jgi:hypothetical protein
MNSNLEHRFHAKLEDIARALDEKDYQPTDRYETGTSQQKCKFLISTG